MNKWSKLMAFGMALCLTATTVSAEVATLTTTPQEATGTISGDLSAEGHFYTDYVTMEEALEAGNRVHLKMVEEGQVLLKNENGALPLKADVLRVAHHGSTHSTTEAFLRAVSPACHRAPVP